MHIAISAACVRAGGDDTFVAQVHRYIFYTSFQAPLKLREQAVGDGGVRAWCGRRPQIMAHVNRWGVSGQHTEIITNGGNEYIWGRV